MFVVIVIFMVCVCLSSAFCYVSLFDGGWASEWVLRCCWLCACSNHTAIGESVWGRWCIHWLRWMSMASFFVCNSFTCFQFDCVGSLAPTVSNSMSQCVRVGFIRTLVLDVCFSSSFIAHSSSSSSLSSSWMSLWVRCKHRQGWRLCPVFIVPALAWDAERHFNFWKNVCLCENEDITRWATMPMLLIVVVLKCHFFSLP